MEYYLPRNYTGFLALWWPMKRSAVAILVLAPTLLAGCASRQTVSEPIELPNNTTVLEELRHIAVEARDEMRLLAKAHEAQAQKSMTREQHEQRFFQAVHVPAGFEKQVSFSYSGEARKAAEAMAAIAGYTFKVDGAPLPRDPYVRIFIKDQPLNEALKELGMQTGDMIRVEVHEASRQMLFRYKQFRADEHAGG